MKKRKCEECGRMVRADEKYVRGRCLRCYWKWWKAQQDEPLVEVIPNVGQRFHAHHRDEPPEHLHPFGPFICTGIIQQTCEATALYHRGTVWQFHPRHWEFRILREEKETMPR